MRVGRLVAAAAATIIIALSALAAPEGEGPVKVFILAGQSNMEGAARFEATSSATEERGASNACSRTRRRPIASSTWSTTRAIG